MIGSPLVILHNQERRLLMIIPVLLCGGSGTRLWPVSRKAHPKQFYSFTGDKSLFSETLERSSASFFEDPLVITGENLRFFVNDELQSAHIQPLDIFLEPEGKNTAASVAAAAVLVEKNTPDALMLVEPSDHHIPDKKAFAEMVAAAVSCAQAGNIVTFGIKPSYPETGYGWLKIDEQLGMDTQKPVPLVSFTEKPCQELAEEYFNSNKYVWNSGIFLFSVHTIIKAFEKEAPEVLADSYSGTDR